MVSTREGPYPLEINLASLAACMNTVFRMLSKKEKMKVGDIKFEVRGDIDYEGLLKGTRKAHFDGIEVDMVIQTDGEMEKVLEILERVEIQCPIESAFREAEIPIKNNVTLDDDF